MANKPPPNSGKLPQPIRPKSIMRVDRGGKVQVGVRVSHPSPVERIASIHRNTQWALNNLQRSLHKSLQKRGK